jgi:hypothetical protein
MCYSELPSDWRGVSQRHPSIEIVTPQVAEFIEAKAGAVRIVASQLSMPTELLVGMPQGSFTSRSTAVPATDAGQSGRAS